MKSTYFTREERIFLVKVLGKYLMSNCDVRDQATKAEKVQMAQSIITCYPVLKRGEGLGYEHFYDPRSHIGFLELYIRQRRSRYSINTVVTATDAERLLRERHPTGANDAELLQLLEETRSARRQWIVVEHPTISAILLRYPRLLDVNNAVHEEFMAVTNCANDMALRDTWHSYRDKILQLACEGSSKNPDLKKVLVSANGNYDEEQKTKASFEVLPYLLRMAPKRGVRKARVSAGAVFGMLYTEFEDTIPLEDALHQLTEGDFTQPLLLKCGGKTWVKVD